MSDTEKGSELKQIMLEGMQHANEAKRRLWKAVDRVTELETLLAAAKNRRDEAQREYSESHGILAQTWDFFRSEVERVWGDAHAPGLPPDPQAKTALPGATSEGLTPTTEKA